MEHHDVWKYIDIRYISAGNPVAFIFVISQRIGAGQVNPSISDLRRNGGNNIGLGELRLTVGIPG